MSKPAHKTIETVSNIVIILVFLIVGTMFLKTYYFTRHAPPMARPVTGSKLNISGEDFRSNRNTLVIALQQGCHYCAESVPFYQKIIAARKNDLHLLVLLPEDNSLQYVRNLHLDVTDVKQASFSSYHVGATPTLIYVNSQGIIANVWMGKLTPAIEGEVMNTLAIACDQCVVTSGK
jgi:hypothetical protein